MKTIILTIIAIEKRIYLQTGRAGRVLRRAWMIHGRKLQNRLNAQHGTTIEYAGMI